MERSFAADDQEVEIASRDRERPHESLIGTCDGRVASFLPLELPGSDESELTNPRALLCGSYGRLAGARTWLVGACFRGGNSRVDRRLHFWRSRLHVAVPQLACHTQSQN